MERPQLLAHVGGGVQPVERPGDQADVGQVWGRGGFISSADLFLSFRRFLIHLQSECLERSSKIHLSFGVARLIFAPGNAVTEREEGLERNLHCRGWKGSLSYISSRSRSVCLSVCLSACVWFVSDVTASSVLAQICEVVEAASNRTWKVASD